MPTSRLLSIHDHSRQSASLRYVYTVLSRRAGGVSVGINLNPDHTCNWACVYCQVEGLRKGVPPPPDLRQLEMELRGLLRDALQGDFLVRHAPPEARVIKDIAFSGNGEPTLSPAFAEAVSIVQSVMRECTAESKHPPLYLRLISNGSQMHRLSVQRGVALLGESDVPGEVWFKLDRATPKGTASVNKNRQNPSAVLNRLRRCAQLAPTWLQSCWFALDGSPPSAGERDAWLQLAVQAAPCLRGVHLYGVARTSMQTGAQRLSDLPRSEMEDFAAEIHAHTGLLVNIAY